MWSIDQAAAESIPKFVIPKEEGSSRESDTLVVSDSIDQVTEDIPVADISQDGFSCENNTVLVALGTTLVAFVTVIISLGTTYIAESYWS
ncbi:hypothetical protein INT48_001369 [Thamnidium elegans]|uniref:Uncharacterized protein n=1 Tax=Thamnidium elegans TaxID=101142 RepID=A0A8H7SWF7_9FUNG|nr:hypothetical protein INT48_001369 [Thamnidium elegans]